MDHENELLRKIMQGEPEALEELLRIYYPLLFRYCLWHTPNRETAEDAVQDVVLKIFQFKNLAEHTGKYLVICHRTLGSTRNLQFRTILNIWPL